MKFIRCSLPIGFLALKLPLTWAPVLNKDSEQCAKKCEQEQLKLPLPLLIDQPRNKTSTLFASYLITFCSAKIYACILMKMNEMRKSNLPPKSCSGAAFIKVACWFPSGTSDFLTVKGLPIIKYVESAQVKPISSGILFSSSHCQWW